MECPARCLATAITLVAALAFAACGGTGTTETKTERTLTAAEFPAVYGWMAQSEPSVVGVDAVCGALRAAPSTPVITATRKLCEAYRSTQQTREKLKIRLHAECPGSYTCTAGILGGPYRDVLDDLRRAYDDWYGVLGATLEDGPCRRALIPADLRDKADRYLESYDDAVAQLKQGDRRAYYALRDQRNERRDISSCRPA
jgi:hypothetical protein